MDTQTALDLVSTGQCELVGREKVDDKFMYGEYRFGFYIITVTFHNLNGNFYIVRDPDRVEIEMEFNLN